MAKGIEAGEVLAGLARVQGAEAVRDFARRVKKETGTDLAFTLVEKGRKRKHRWGTAQGRVVAVRYTDAEYEKLEGRARPNRWSVGAQVKFETTRSHRKGQGRAPGPGAGPSPG